MSFFFNLTTGIVSVNGSCSDIPNHFSLKKCSEGQSTRLGAQWRSVLCLRGLYSQNMAGAPPTGEILYSGYLNRKKEGLFSVRFAVFFLTITGRVAIFLPTHMSGFVYFLCMQTWKRHFCLITEHGKLELYDKPRPVAVGSHAHGTNVAVPT